MEQAKIVEHDRACEGTKAEVLRRGFKGPWNREPNRKNWKHAGLDCMLVRHPTGLHWCGYVGVPPGHRLHGKSYGEIEGHDAPGLAATDVHGGLTYSAGCEGHICHIPAQGEPDALWWFGFDCAHSGDQSPGSLRKEYPFTPSDYETYKTEAYVTKETENLAEQLA